MKFVKLSILVYALIMYNLMIQLHRGLLLATMVNKSSEQFKLRICQLIPMVNRHIKFLFIYIMGTTSNICSWQYSLTCKCFFFHRLILSSNKLQFCGKLQTTWFHYLAKKPTARWFLNNNLILCGSIFINIVQIKRAWYEFSPLNDAS